MKKSTISKTSLMSKLMSTNKSSLSSVLSESEFFTKEDIATDYPILNLALSSKLDKGFTPGLTMLAGPSKHFKTGFALIMLAAFQKKYPESVVIFYDSEFGCPQTYFDNFGVDTSKIIHTPVHDIEELRFDIMAKLKEIEKDDNVLILIDSIGNLASRKEVENAEESKTTEDMTRAKKLKSLFRIITPYLTTKNIPLIAVNHTYQELGLFPKTIVGGGTGSYYGADTIIIVGRQQEKDKENNISGYNFVINIEKSRFVKEKSKFIFNASFDEGINKYSGLLELALASGHVVNSSKGKYSKVNLETGEIEEKQYKEKETRSAIFFDSILKDSKFSEFVHNKYSLENSDTKNVTEEDE
jgi:RecA/RadA recombinase